MSNQSTVKNIIIGAASVYLGPPGIVKPAYVAATSYRTTLDADTDWTGVGLTTDGLEVATDPTWDDVQVDQLLDAAVIFKSAMSVNISTTFSEATLENLLVAWGQNGGSGHLKVASDLSFDDDTDTLPTGDREIALEGGALGDAPEEHGLIAVGNAVKKAGASNVYGERVYHAYRVLSVEASSHTLARSEAVTIPVTFRALPGDNTGGRYGKVRDRLMV